MSKWKSPVALVLAAFVLAAFVLAACGGEGKGLPQTAQTTAEDGTFKFDKTSHSVNPQYTLHGLRHLVMDNRSYAEKYAENYPEQWKTAEEHFGRAETAFQAGDAEAADTDFRVAMEQYQVILKTEQQKKEAK
ncbi:hypothetical protein [Neisseria animalis]|uniref:Uncharacterized protein n=1 Tax=Neisseria animalis TaxID=492 RepID=A0A5P3MQ55_NEIAN|nr:hypothetical protein [Neisseria animalis]QEY23717.1 hypothetical protein D0T90_03680 [Neisseria animalis]ROW32859.1 hypothetical protein CGZ60_03295 [Neisseria animalis]VEE09548.1 Uncharacterised protein [Neisseria animalis]